MAVLDEVGRRVPQRAESSAHAAGALDEIATRVENVGEVRGSARCSRSSSCTDRETQGAGGGARQTDDRSRPRARA
jgi:hypothetical protein